MNSLAAFNQQQSDALAPYDSQDGLIAMQYSYVLPTDYDMALIRQRIKEKAFLMDGFPNLVFKAFGYSAVDYAYAYSQNNLYAPFYLWRNYAGLNQFLASDGFAALTRAFGWPLIKTWSVLYAQLRDTYAITSWAVREQIDVSPYTQIDELRLRESENIRQQITAKHILGGISAFDPASWTLVRYRLLTHYPRQEVNDTLQVYQVGYLATDNTHREFQAQDSA